MTSHPRVWWLVPFGLVLLSAAPAADPEDLLRRGNAAFARADYATAVAWYAQAEERTIDPGLIAFNKAAALYRLGQQAQGNGALLRYREAELHYRRCLEDAEGPRRARAWYDLGNCLLMRSQGTDAGLLKGAIDYYETCLSQGDADESLLTDARHNLALAKQLWLIAKETATDEGGSSQPGASPDSSHHRGKTNDGADGPRPRTGNRTPDQTASASKTPKHLRNGVETDHPAPPGKGNLPPVPDEDELVPMSPEDTVIHLQQATARIWRERREHQQRSVPAQSRKVMDW